MDFGLPALSSIIFMLSMGVAQYIGVGVFDAGLKVNLAYVASRYNSLKEMR